MEQFEQVLTKIIEWLPTVVGILGNVAVILGAIRAIANIKNTTNDKVNVLCKKVSENERLLGQIAKENIELKQALTQKTMDEHKIYTREHKRGD